MTEETQSCALKKSFLKRVNKKKFVGESWNDCLERAWAFAESQMEEE